MKQEFAPGIKKAIADVVVEFIKSATCTKSDLAGILNMPAPMLSMVANETHLEKIASIHWETFRDIYNKKIYIDAHLIKDVRETPMKVYNMMEYKSKWAHGGGKRKDQNTAMDMPQTMQKAAPWPEDQLTPGQAQQMMMFWKQNPDVTLEQVIEGYKESISKPKGPAPQKAALTDEDIARLKKFGLNFKRGVYMVYEDIVVELLAPVDMHNILSQIIRGEFDRFINNVEWEFEDYKSDIKTLKVKIR